MTAVFSIVFHLYTKKESHHCDSGSKWPKLRYGYLQKKSPISVTPGVNGRNCVTAIYKKRVPFL